MMKILLASLVLFFSCEIGVSGSPKPEPKKLVDKVFFDDFDTFNSDYWTAIERGAAWNDEVQAYSPNNVKVENGNLVIESKKENWVGPPNLPHHPDNNKSTVEKAYTSGQVESKGKFSFTYGKVQVRAKMEVTPGMLNAIWMVPESGQWPPK